MIIELDISGARVIVSGENLSVSVIEGDVQRRCVDGASPLAAWRRLAGMTQDDLAKTLGLDQSFISRVESGHSSVSLEHAVIVERMTGGVVPASSLIRRVA